MKTLTTAETLLLETLIAHRLVGVTTSTFKKDLWIRPQLESLQDMGLVVWSFNTDADFQVTSTEALRTSTLASEAIGRLIPQAHDALHATAAAAP